MLGTGALLLNGRHLVGELLQCLSSIPRLHNFPLAMEQVPGYRVLDSHHRKKAHTHFYAAFRLALRFLTSTLLSHGALRLVNHRADARGNALPRS